MTGHLLIGCDRCHRPFYVLAQIGKRYLCFDCSRGLQPDRFVRAE